jgi:hypothetical protein
MPKCQNSKIPKFQNSKIPKCQNAKMPKCQSAKLHKIQNAKMLNKKMPHLKGVSYSIFRISGKNKIEKHNGFYNLLGAYLFRLNGARQFCQLCCFANRTKVNFVLCH